jgi:hypothetical protein
VTQVEVEIKVERKLNVPHLDLDLSLNLPESRRTGFWMAIKRVTMKIICSWCRQEGKREVVGEKAPLDDARETHGICVAHRHTVEARWQASIHTASRSRVATGLYSSFFRWTGLLNVTKKMRP